MKLFDLLHKFHNKNEVEKEIECPISNPLNLKFNSLIDIKSGEFFGIDFKLAAIEEYTRNVHGQKFVFTDYTLKSNEIDHVKLRILENDAIVFTELDNFAYSDEFQEVLKETECTGCFEITDEILLPYTTGEVTNRYHRLNNIKHSWDTSVKKLIDIDGNGIITKSDPVTESTLKYWDFCCDLEKDELKYTEFLVIERNEENGWFTLWKGNYADLHSIFII